MMRLMTLLQRLHVIQNNGEVVSCEIKIQLRNKNAGKKHVKYEHGEKIENKTIY